MIALIIIIISAVVAVVFGILILAGKGDDLIAGYNIAPEEEREKYDIKRLRLCIGVLLIVVALLVLLNIKPSDSASILAVDILIVVLALVAVILANTWAKKKK